MRFPIDGHINNMDADTIKHLDYIQNAISRMADTSFKIKGLAITVVSAFIGIYVKTSNINFLWALIFPLVLFWILDSYYLQQERKLRAIYNILINKEHHFGFKIRKFDIPLEKIKGCRYKLFSVMVSKTEICFYLGIIVLILISCMMIYCKTNYK